MSALEIPIADFEVVDSAEATRRADELRPSCVTWLRRARRLFKDLPQGTRIYFEGDSGLCLMALSVDGRAFVKRSGGEDQSAIIDTIQVPNADCGGW